MRTRLTERAFDRRGRARTRSSSGALSTALLYARAASVVNVTATVGAVTQQPCLFSGDSYSVDGVTAKVGALVDLLDPTHLAEQATSAAQCAVPTSDATLSGAQSLTFNNAQYYVSNRAASAFRYLHSGPCWSAAIFVPTATGQRIIASTVRLSLISSQVGWYMSRSSTAAEIRAGNGTGIAVNAGPAATFSSNARYSLGYDYLEGASPEYHTRQSGSALSDGSSGAAPVTTDPQSTLVIGASAADFAVLLQARLAFFMATPMQPTASQIATVSAYTVRKYGVAL
jgi:hypothetical protein